MKKLYCTRNFFTKIHPVGTELFLADRQTDVTKLIVCFEMLRTRLKTGFTTEIAQFKELILHRHH